MDINKLQNKLVNCIAEGLANKYEDVEASLQNDGLYAYTLYCVSGFYAMCIAASTEKSLVNVKKNVKESSKKVLESLKDQPDLLTMYSPSSDLYAEMTACEWEYIYNDIPEFKSLEYVVDEIYEYSYQINNQDFDVNECLTHCILEGIKSFKKSSSFNEELLTGLQFGDPSEQETQIEILISSQVNQNYWHEKVISLYNERDNLHT